MASKSWLTGLLLFLTAGPGLTGEPARQATLLQDLRTQPLLEADEIERRGLAPLIDNRYWNERLSYLLREFAPGSKNTHFQPRNLSYHIDIRAEAFDGFPIPKNFVEYVDLSVPDSGAGNGPASGKLDPFARALVDALKESAERTARTAGWTAVSDPLKADLLIRVNLTEQQQSSRGFSFDGMSRLPDRVAQPPNTPPLKEALYAYPWSLARIYYQETLSTRDVLGGEIWIDYPIRTYLQERVARVLLDNPALQSQIGLDQSRAALIEAFRNPAKMALPHLRVSASKTREVWQGPRPGASLLSIAMLALNPGRREGAIIEAEFFGKSAGCALAQHSVALAGRLSRLMTVFATGRRLGGYRIDDQTDEHAEFLRDPDPFLASLSLGGYKDAFDQISSDQVANLILAGSPSNLLNERPAATERSVPEPKRYPLEAQQILDLHRSDLTSIIGVTARSLSTGDTCITRHSIEELARVAD